MKRNIKTKFKYLKFRPFLFVNSSFFSPVKFIGTSCEEVLNMYFSRFSTVLSVTPEDKDGVETYKIRYTTDGSKIDEAIWRLID